jgi:G:T-mismatch repair DNA endonuclease (very short patch repair protein)
MTDVHDKKTRSFNMSRSRSKDTKPESLKPSFSVTLYPFLCEIIS